MTFKETLQGYVKIRITGYSPERFLNLCKHREITIWGLEAKKDGYEMYIRLKGFRKLKPILKKTRCKVVVLERNGLPFFLHKNQKRKSFFLGSVLCIALVFLLSRYIWKIDIQGNQTITNQVILEYLEQEDIFHGMKRKEVQCEEIVTKLRKEFQDIIWVSASVEGCNLILSVRENTDTFSVNQEEKEPGNIIANADGVITDIVTRNGVPCVQVGDVVQKGDVLVSGIVEVMNDAGEVVREDARSADADVYAEVVFSYDDFCERVYQEKFYQKNIKKQGYVRFGNLYLGVGLRKAKTDRYEIASKEIQAAINDSFILPVFLGVRSVKEYVWKSKTYEASEMEKILEENYQWYRKNLEDEGVEILSENLQFITGKNGISKVGTIRVKSPIGTWVKMS